MSVTPGHSMRGASDIEVSGTSWLDNLAKNANFRFSERLT